MRFVLSVIAVLFIGCTTPPQVSPVDGGSPDADAGPLPGLDPVEGITRYCHDTHQAICEGLLSCTCPLEFRGGDVATCTARRAAACETQLSPLVPLMAQGQTKITAQGIADCVAGLKSIANQCSLLKDDTMPLACAGFFMDTAGIGEPCRGPTEFHLCADGVGACDQSSEARLCTALPGDGEDCAGGEACGAGLVCVNHQKCVRQGGAGAPCDSIHSCRLGLACGRDQHCVMLYGEGASCEDSSQCAEGLKCDGKKCQPVSELGSACSRENACGPWRTCVASSKYRHCAPKAGEGESCQSTDDCAEGLGCSDTSWTCVTLPAKGEECINRALCAAGLVCDENLSECVTPPGDGDACLIGNAACAEGLACDENNVCRPPPSTDGEPCAQPGNVCGAGLACDFTESGSFCHERRAVGGNCQNDVICKDGLYCSFDTGKCAEPFLLGAECRLGNECGPGRECSRLGGQGYRCRELPTTVGADCEFACGGDLVCLGAGGECARMICGTR